MNDKTEICSLKKCAFVSCTDNTYYFSRGVSSEELVNTASWVMEQQVKQVGEAFTNVADVSSFVRMKLGMSEREIFAILYLDNKHRLIEYSELFFGTIDSCAVHPREIVKQALQLNANAVVLAHNHPSGNVEPSQADHNITQKVKLALDTVDIRLLDHFIVCSLVHFCSFAQRGLL